MRRAFTMIEMVLVVVIVGMVALLAVPRLSASRVGLRLDAAEARLRSEFAAISALSRSTGRTHAIQFNADNSELRVFEGKAADKDHLVYAVSLAARPYTTRIGSVTIADGRATVVVDPYGIYSSDAKVQITSGSISRVVSLGGPRSGAPVESVKDASQDPGLIGGLLQGLLGGL